MHETPNSPQNKKLEGELFSSCSIARFVAGLIAGTALSFMVSFFTIVGLMNKGSFVPQNMALNTAQQEQNTPPVPDTPPAPSEPKVDVNKISPVSNKDWVRGKKSDIAIIEYTDPSCPFCKQFHTTLENLSKKYEGKISWVYRHHPIVQLHPNAPKEAEALECAGEIGGKDSFWNFADAIYGQKESLSVDKLKELATSQKLNREKFAQCLDSGKHKEKVDAHTKEIEAAGIMYTPFSVIIAGDQRIPIEGATPEAQIEEMLKPLIK